MQIQAVGGQKRSYGGNSPTENETRKRRNVEVANHSWEKAEDDETESIMRIMSQHADHRGPRETGMAGDNLARRYFRSRTWRGEQQPAGQAAAPSGRPNSAYAYFPVSADYICHMCGEKGHHIKACPKRQGRRHTKKIRPATGIPRSWLQLVDPSKIVEYDNVYSLPNGQLTVLRPGAGGCATSSGSAGANEDLKCSICQLYFTNATMTPCCGITFCQPCILSTLTNSQGRRCPSCGRGPISQQDLEPNAAVQESVDAATGRPPHPSTQIHTLPPPKQDPVTLKLEASKPHPLNIVQVATGYQPPFQLKTALKPEPTLKQEADNPSAPVPPAANNSSAPVLYAANNPSAPS